MMPLQTYGRYNEYESHLISFFIIMFSEFQKKSLSNVFFILKKLTMHLHI
jgi:hypothetical protein